MIALAFTPAAMRIDAKGAADRDRPAAGAALRLDLEAGLLVVRPLDADYAVGEVDVVPPESHEFATAEAGV